jgi:hypothetical protein
MLPSSSQPARPPEDRHSTTAMQTDVEWEHVFFLLSSTQMSARVNIVLRPKWSISSTPFPFSEIAASARSRHFISHESCYSFLVVEYTSSSRYSPDSELQMDSTLSVIQFPYISYHP